MHWEYRYEHNIRPQAKNDLYRLFNNHSIRKEDIKCPEFWEKEYTQKYARLWQTIQQETPGEKAILENGIDMFALCDDSTAPLSIAPGFIRGKCQTA